MRRAVRGHLREGELARPEADAREGDVHPFMPGLAVPTPQDGSQRSRNDDDRWHVFGTVLMSTPSVCELGVKHGQDNGTVAPIVSPGNEYT